MFAEHSRMFSADEGEENSKQKRETEQIMIKEIRYDFWR